MRYESMRSPIAAILSFLLFSPCHVGAEPQTSPASKPGLSIDVIAGQNAGNSLKAKSATPLILEVHDAGNRPVPGAVLQLSTPLDGPGIVFPNGSRAITLVTETDGRVSLNGMTPEGTGVFNLSVEASAAGEFADATITQCNSENGTVRPGTAASESLGRSGPAGKHMSKTVIFGIIAGVAVAAAVGVAVGLHNSGHSSSTSGIGVGTPTVGAP